jgi:hypothetical protein
MTKEQMINELTEWQLHHMSVIDMMFFFTAQYKAVLDEEYNESEIAAKYKQVFGDEEVMH